MRSIRGRLLAMLLLGLTVVLLAGGSAVYWIADTNLERQFDAGLEDRARTLASLVVLEGRALTFDSGSGPAALMSETHFELHTEAGEFLKRSDSLDDHALPAREVAEGDRVFDDVLLPADVHGRAVWYAFRPRVDDDDDDEEPAEAGEEAIDGPRIAPEVIVVTAAVDREPVDRALATLLGALLSVGAIVALTVAMLVALGVRWGLVPLDRLTRQLGEVDGASLSQRFVDTRAPRELAPVYHELNRMLDRVEHTLERERAFAAAAAHELRTPLAELRTTAEVAIRWPDRDRAAHVLSEMLAIGREMERLVESLLMISRGDAEALEGGTRETPLATVVSGCLDRASGAIARKSLTLDVEVDEDGLVPAPRDAMEIIVRNLVDNAVHYTPRNGRITIRGKGTTNGAPALIVENDPVQLEPGDLPRLFEPFWRLEGARSDRTHAGLGLAVVSHVAEVIGFAVDASLEGDRLRMQLRRSS